MKHTARSSDKQQLVRKIDEEDRIFSHALYHVVAFWAAFMVTAGLLLNAGVMVATVTKPGGVRLIFCAAAIVALALASLYFVLRINAFSKTIESRLPDGYLKSVWLFRQNWVSTPVLAVAAVVTVAIAD